MSEQATEAKVSREEQLAALKASFNNTVDVAQVKYFFKKVKEKDSEGKETGVETKRPTIELDVPYPSYEGLIGILNNPESAECRFLLETVRERVADRARELLNDDEKLTAETFPHSQLAWTIIANLPPAERRGGGIAKETWEEFVKDYVAIMPGLTGKNEETIQKSALLFAQKFSTVKTVKKVLRKLQELLGIYAEGTTRGEEFTECIEFLSKKLTNLLNVDEQAQADDL